MFEIRNDALRVSLLEPEKDRVRMGARYCTGGYIFQVHDTELGPLLTGPTYPESFNWFDGQGIPDSFFHLPLRSPANPGPDALVLGIGVCNTARQTVSTFDTWDVRSDVTSAKFTCVHVWDVYHVMIERTVALTGRVLSSVTRIENRGDDHLPFIWFPHPFFPHPAGAAIASLAEEAVITGEDVFAVRPDGYLTHTDPMSAEAVSATTAGAQPFAYTYRHPVLGLILIRYSYPTTHSVVWGNQRTFSIEPYLNASVGRAGSVLEFTAEYHF